MKWNAEMPFKLSIAWQCKLSNSNCSIIPLAGPTGLWPDSLLRVQILPYQIFNDPKIY